MAPALLPLPACCGGRGGGRDAVHVSGGAQDRASLSFMGMASFGMGIGIFCGFLFIVLPSSVVLGLDLLELALSRPQVSGVGRARRSDQAAAAGAEG